MTYEEAVDQYDKLVHALAKKVYRQTDLPINFLDDLIQEGYIALMQAVDRFDESRGFKFTTFAYPTVWGVMMKKAKAAVRTQTREKAGMMRLVYQHEQCRWSKITKMIRKEQWTVLQEIVVDLRYTDRAVMEGFMAGKKSCEIAEDLGVSRTRVNYVRNRALKRIENELRQRDASSINRHTASLEV